MRFKTNKILTIRINYMVVCFIHLRQAHEIVEKLVLKGLKTETKLAVER